AVGVSESEGSRVEVEIVVIEAAHFAAELQPMASALPAQCVGENRGRVPATLWESPWASKIEADAVDDHLWESNRGGNTVVDAEVGGIELRIGVNVMWMRLKPRRASLTIVGPKIWTSLRVKIWR